MASTGTASELRTPADLADSLRTADRVRVVGRADGDGLAAAVIYGRALASLAVPRHLSLSSNRDAAGPPFETTGVTVTPGLDDQKSSEESAALAAYETALELGTDPDPELALAGAIAADVEPHGPALDTARERGLDTRPGIGIPTPDLRDGLAYSTRFHAPFSGDPDAVTAFLEDWGLSDPTDDDERRELASAVALEATAEAPGDRAVSALERTLATRGSSGPFETLAGFADVLNAAARFDPGLGLAALLRTVDRERLLDAWEQYGTRVHEAVAAMPRTDESTVTATVESVPPVDVARLGHAFRVSVDRVAVAGQETVALAATEADASAELRSAADGPVYGDAALAILDAGTATQAALAEVER